jgi:hypothetical protein
VWRFQIAAKAIGKIAIEEAVAGLKRVFDAAEARERTVLANSVARNRPRRARR